MVAGPKKPTVNEIKNDAESAEMAGCDLKNLKCEVKFTNCTFFS